MKRTDARTVDLTAEETAMFAAFENYLAEGHSIQRAGIMALDPLPEWATDEFVRYMSDGTLAVHHGTLVRVRNPRHPRRDFSHDPRPFTLDG